MKKKSYYSIVLGMLLCMSVGTVNSFAKEESNIPKLKINGNTLEPKKTTNTSSKEIVYLPKEEVEEIEQLQKKYKVAMSEPTVDIFEKNPILKDGVYELGIYNDEVLESIERRYNFYRELINIEPLQMTEANNIIAQHGAMGIASVNKMTHYLSNEKKPGDMPDDFWVKADQATRTSNLSYFASTVNVEKNLGYHLDSFIVDSGDNNKQVGHRINLLGLNAESFGVGYARANGLVDNKWYESYSSLYVKPDNININKKYDKHIVTQWPAEGKFPIQLYNRDNKKEKNMRWSVSFNAKGYELSDNISIELLNSRTKDSVVVENDEKGGELLSYGANPGYYPRGGYSTVVFKPNDDFKVEVNTKYTVKVSGIIKDGEPYTYTYTTHMVDMDAEYVGQDEAEKELDEYKKTNKENLAKHKDLSAYREAQQEEIKAILNESNGKIDQVSDKASVDTLVKEAKAKLDKIKTDAQLTAEENETSAKELAEYKKTNKENLAKHKDLSDYRQVQQEEIKTILNEVNSKIDKASDKASVDILVKEAKTTLDKIKTDAQLTAEENETSGKELAEYKKTTKANLAKHKDLSAYREAQQEEIKTILNEVNNKIDKASDKASIDTLIQEVKITLDKVKTDAELTAEENETSGKELAEYKKTTKANLAKHKDLSAYREAQQEEIKTILNEVNSKIDKAIDKAIVDTLVKEAKTTLDKVKTDAQLTAEENETTTKELAEYKKTTKENLAKHKDLSAYREAQQEEIKAILTESNSKIDKASDKTSVDTLVKEAKTALDKVKTDAQLTTEENEASAKELADYKKTNKANLAKHKNLSDYRQVQQEEIKAILSEVNDKIDKASDKASVDALVQEAKTALDKVKTDAELTAEENETTAKELAEYKKTTKENLAKHKDLSDYREAQQEEINSILNETNTKIDEVGTKSEVDVLVELAKTTLDKVKTDAQLTNEENENQKAGVIYIDSRGTHTLDIAKGSTVSLSASKNSIVITVNKQKTELKNIKEVTFKGITVDRLIPFYMNGLKKVTLEKVNFQKGIDFSGMKDLESLIVKDSKFGSTDYSLAIHSAPKLTDLTVDNSLFEADFRIYSNQSLETATLSNSVFKKDLKQYSNKKGYETKSINNRFERSKIQRVISTGGMSKDDVFYMNPTADQVGSSKFNTKQAGFVEYIKNGVSRKIDVPAGVQITSVTDTKDTVKIKLSNGQVTEIDGADELRFEQVDIQTAISFVSKNLQLKKIAFVDSRTQLIDIAYSKTITDVEISNTEISQKTGYLSIYNNELLKKVELKNSEVTGTSGYISVYNNQQLDDYVMTNVYTHGYLSAYNLGDATLQITNSLFDDYISTNQTIAN